MNKIGGNQDAAFWAAMNASAEAGAQASNTICPQCQVDMAKGLGCGGCSASCPGMRIFSRIHASECAWCATDTALTMGTHRQGKGNPVGACTANIGNYQGAIR